MSNVPACITRRIARLNKQIQAERKTLVMQLEQLAADSKDAAMYYAINPVVAEFPFVRMGYNGVKETGDRITKLENAVKLLEELAQDTEFLANATPEAVDENAEVLEETAHHEVGNCKAPGTCEACEPA